MSGGLGGLTPWLIQRISAVWLGLFLAGLVVVLLIHGGWDYDGWRALLRHPAMIVAVLLLYLALLAHAWVGIRDVVVDYIHPLALRLAALTIIAASLVIFGFWALLILTGLAYA